MEDNTKKVDNGSLAGTLIKAVPKDKENIGVDVDNDFIHTLLDNIQINNVDFTTLENFLGVAQNREKLYQLIDIMEQDSKISSILDAFAGDATLRNADGNIVWVESEDENCRKYVQYLLDVLRVDKNAYGWIYNLIKYGDLYLRLYRQSDFDEEEIFDVKEADKRERLNEGKELPKEKVNEDSKEQESLKEDVILQMHQPKDHFANYVEDVSNPGEMFELTKLGKTMGFIQAPYNVYNAYMTTNNGSGVNESDPSWWQYDVVKDDVTIYPATEFVHAYLDDNSGRTPEEVNIFLNKNDMDSKTSAKKYKVTRGKSMLYDWFQSWRELALLENSVILNRLTKSSIVRVIGVEVGDMPKEMIGPHMQSIKSMFEQKASINTGKNMMEYTNPGPVANNIYTPIHNGMGGFTVSAVGGDVDPKQLTDLDYFLKKFYSGTGIPKEFFGWTGDNAGFSGGESLALISSEYGKKVKRIQNSFIFAITDLINILLLDRGLSAYVNNFKIKMNEPVTREELDRRESQQNAMGLLSDTMNALTDIEDKATRLKIVKTLITNISTNSEITEYIQDEIDRLEALEEENPQGNNNNGEGNREVKPIGMGNGPSHEQAMNDIGRDLGLEEPNQEENNLETPEMNIGGEEASEETGGSDYLPSPQELGVDLT